MLLTMPENLWIVWFDTDSDIVLLIILLVGNRGKLNNLSEDKMRIDKAKLQIQVLWLPNFLCIHSSFEHEC